MDKAHRLMAADSFDSQQDGFAYPNPFYMTSEYELV